VQKESPEKSWRIFNNIS